MYEATFDVEADQDARTELGNRLVNQWAASPRNGEVRIETSEGVLAIKSSTKTWYDRNGRWNSDVGRGATLVRWQGAGGRGR